jgi:hypothetical protein
VGGVRAVVFWGLIGLAVGCSLSAIALLVLVVWAGAGENEWQRRARGGGLGDREG